jgi:hypothetical protein
MPQIVCAMPDTKASQDASSPPSDARDQQRRLPLTGTGTFLPACVGIHASLQRLSVIGFSIFDLEFCEAVLTALRLGFRFSTRTKRQKS